MLASRTRSAEGARSGGKMQYYNTWRANAKVGTFDRDGQSSGAKRTNTNAGLQNVAQSQPNNVCTLRKDTSY
eukprot:6042430-Pleurochrysis_carterae.AAC.5